MSHAAGALDEAMENPHIHGHLLTERLANIVSLYQEKEWEYKRKKKKRLGEEIDQSEVHPEVLDLQQKLHRNSLSSFK